MRNILTIAAVMICLGTFMSQMADRLSSASATAAPREMSRETARELPQKADVANVSEPLAANRSLSIPPDPRGHFRTEGRIDGQYLNFMVDTGASIIALNESSAARFGLYPSPGDYTAKVSTANGTVKGAPTRLARVDIGGLVVRDVDAMVLPDEALSENLLGLSFLSRLKRYEYTNGKMVLEQ